jgi:hypothetical protein
MRIELINKNDLDNIDFNLVSSHINSEKHKQYFLNVAGQEHYRLLAYLSLNNYSDQFIDIGTFKGCSALSFSVNPNVTVNTFNVVDEMDLNNPPKNINFFIDDVTKPEYKENILSSKIVFLDTLHDGTFERIFMKYLEEIGYKGVLILDDIHYFGELKRLWDDIHLEKYDITEIGHWSGTGLVYYN